MQLKFDFIVQKKWPFIDAYFLQIDQLAGSSKHFVPKLAKSYNSYCNQFLKNFHESSRGSLISFLDFRTWEWLIPT